MYIVLRLITSSTIFKLLASAILLVTVSAFTLIYFQFELYGALLIITELTVFFFFFVLFFSKNVSWVAGSPSIALLLVFCFLLGSANTTYFDVVYINWYNFLWDVNNDVITLFIYLFINNVLILPVVGLLLFIVTLLITWASFFNQNILYQNLRLTKKSFFFIKRQKKKNYIRKKPLFYVKNNNDF